MSASFIGHFCQAVLLRAKSQYQLMPALDILDDDAA